MTEGGHDFILRDGMCEFRIADLAAQLPTEEAAAYLRRALTHLGWEASRQSGLRIGDGIPKPIARDEVEETIRRLRASGIAAPIQAMHRPRLVGPWVDSEVDEKEQTVPARRRRFTKEPAPQIAVRPSPRRERPARPVERPPNDPVIDVQLFDDPEESLRYAVRHYYLLTVPRSQREQWPLGTYETLPSFLSDVEEQAGQISMGQIISAIVDVVSGRMNDTNSRKPRPLREGGGDDGRPVVTRADGASAWRGNVSHGTPAARRIMWWRRLDGCLELTRLATHDDVNMPEY
jgi:hypothetical protein